MDTAVLDAIEMSPPPEKIIKSCLSPNWIPGLEPVDGAPEGGAKADGSLVAPPPNHMFAPPVDAGVVPEHTAIVVAQKLPPVTMRPSPLPSLSLQIEISPPDPPDGPFVFAPEFENSIWLLDLIWIFEPAVPMSRLLKMRTFVAETKMSPPAAVIPNRSRFAP